MIVGQLDTFTFKAKFFRKLHFKATFGKSAVDIVAILTHNIEKTMYKQNIANALIFDIKSAFNNIFKNKLIKRL